MSWYVIAPIGVIATALLVLFGLLVWKTIADSGADGLTSSVADSIAIIFLIPVLVVQIGLIAGLVYVLKGHSIASIYRMDPIRHYLLKAGGYVRTSVGVTGRVLYGSGRVVAPLQATIAGLKAVYREMARGFGQGERGK